MKELLRKVKLMKLGNLLAMLALGMATSAANATCTYWLYQERESEELKELRKF